MSDTRADTHAHVSFYKYTTEVIGSGRQEVEQQHLFPSIHVLVGMMVKLETE